MRRFDRLTPIHIIILVGLGVFLMWLFSRYQG
jgi:hypothetical protein